MSVTDKAESSFYRISVSPLPFLKRNQCQIKLGHCVHGGDVCPSSHSSISDVLPHGQNVAFSMAPSCSTLTQLRTGRTPF